MENKKVVFITGASSGIGKATAELFLQKDFIVYGCARTKKENYKFNFVECDVCDEQKVKNALKDIFEKEKRIDVVVNCAGIGIGGAIENTSLEKAKQIFDVNFFGTMNVCKNVLQYLRQTGGGKIFNIGSVAGNIAIPFQAFYSATKSAVESFSKALANEIKPFNIKVCCVLPGDAKTGFTNARTNEIQDNNVYNNRDKRSLQTMEKDEQNGYSPFVVANHIYKLSAKNNLPLTSTVGFKYKLIIGLNRILPQKAVQKIIYKIYAK